MMDFKMLFNNDGKIKHPFIKDHKTLITPSHLSEHGHYLRTRDKTGSFLSVLNCVLAYFIVAFFVLAGTRAGTDNLRYAHPG